MSFLSSFSEHRYTDVRRAIYDMRQDMLALSDGKGEQADAETYIGTLDIMHRDKAPYEALRVQLGKRAASIPFEFTRRQVPGGIVVDREPVNPMTSRMYVDADIYHGFALGQELNDKIYPGSSFAPYVDRLLTSHITDPDEYSRYVENEGTRVFLNTLSSTHGQPEGNTPDPMRRFTEELSDHLHDGDIVRRFQFITGVGIARGAFNLMSLDIDAELEGIKHASQE